MEINLSNVPSVCENYTYLLHPSKDDVILFLKILKMMKYDAMMMQYAKDDAIMMKYDAMKMQYAKDDAIMMKYDAIYQR